MKEDVFDRMRTKLGSVKKEERLTSRILVAFAHGHGLALLCEPGIPREFIQESGTSIDHPFTLEDVYFNPPSVDGVFFGHLVLYEVGPGDTPGTRECGAEIKNWRPVSNEEWRSCQCGEWPEGWRTK